MVKYLKGRKPPTKDLDGGINVESDCESDSTGVGDGMLEGEKEETRAVLITGSFSAYVCVLTPSSCQE